MPAGQWEKHASFAGCEVAQPFKAGEVARPYFAARHGVPVAEAASTTVVARLLDFAALALIATLALPLGALSPAAGIALFGASAVILCGGLALLWLNQVAEAREQLRGAVTAEPDSIYARQATDLLERLEEARAG